VYLLTAVSNHQNERQLQERTTNINNINKNTQDKDGIQITQKYEKLLKINKTPDCTTERS
jgi:hypothetical protein